MHLITTALTKYSPTYYFLSIRASTSFFIPVHLRCFVANFERCCIFLTLCFPAVASFLLFFLFEFFQSLPREKTLFALSRHSLPDTHTRYLICGLFWSHLSFKSRHRNCCWHHMNLGLPLVKAVTPSANGSSAFTWYHLDLGGWGYRVADVIRSFDSKYWMCNLKQCPAACHANLVCHQTLNLTILHQLV